MEGQGLVPFALKVPSLRINIHIHVASVATNYYESRTSYDTTLKMNCQFISKFLTTNICCI